MVISYWLSVISSDKSDRSDGEDWLTASWSWRVGRFIGGFSSESMECRFPPVKRILLGGFPAINCLAPSGSRRRFWLGGATGGSVERGK